MRIRREFHFKKVKESVYSCKLDCDQSMQGQLAAELTEGEIRFYAVLDDQNTSQQEQFSETVWSKLWDIPLDESNRSSEKILAMFAVTASLGEGKQKYVFYLRDLLRSLLRAIFTSPVFDEHDVHQFRHLIAAQPVLSAILAKEEFYRARRELTATKEGIKDPEVWYCYGQQERAWMAICTNSDNSWLFCGRWGWFAEVEHEVRHLSLLADAYTDYDKMRSIDVNEATSISDMPESAIPIRNLGNILRSRAVALLSHTETFSKNISKSLQTELNITVGHGGNRAALEINDIKEQDYQQILYFLRRYDLNMAMAVFLFTLLFRFFCLRHRISSKKNHEQHKASRGLLLKKMMVVVMLGVVAVLLILFMPLAQVGLQYLFTAAAAGLVFFGIILAIMISGIVAILRGNAWRFLLRYPISLLLLIPIGVLSLTFMQLPYSEDICIIGASFITLLPIAAMLLGLVMYFIGKFCGNSADGQSPMLLFRISLPRLLGATLGAWVPIAVTEEIWKHCFMANNHDIVVFGIPMLLASLLFVIVAINNQIRELFFSVWRGIILIAIAMLMSISVGTIASGITSHTFMLNAGVFDPNEDGTMNSQFMRNLFNYADVGPTSLQDHLEKLTKISGKPLSVVLARDILRYLRWPNINDQNRHIARKYFNTVYAIAGVPIVDILKLNTVKGADGKERQLPEKDVFLPDMKIDKKNFGKISVEDFFSVIKQMPDPALVIDGGTHPYMYRIDLLTDNDQKGSRDRRVICIYPGMIIYASCIAVFLAIFLQLLFADTAITEPL